MHVPSMSVRKPHVNSGWSVLGSSEVTGLNPVPVGFAVFADLSRVKPPTSEADLDGMLREQIVLKPVRELMKYQLVESDEDCFR